MRVLVGCECSQVVTAAFRAAGYEAFSCDIQPCYGDFPQYHFQNDLVLKLFIKQVETVQNMLKHR